MWVLTVLVCASVMAPSCEIKTYTGAFFQDAESCLMKGNEYLSDLSSRGLGGMAGCFDVTRIGQDEQEQPPNL